ncbi:MAG: chorismate mutase [Gaiella sp.]
MTDRYDELRRLIAANDREIVARVNDRLVLVQELWAIKAERGAPMVDPDRERALRAALVESSAGPLSEEGCERLVTELLALTKDELGHTR